jgi:hypothetical protein
MGSRGPTAINGDTRLKDHHRFVRGKTPCNIQKAPPITQPLDVQTYGLSLCIMPQYLKIHH